jgi:hypothetical protein
MLQEVEHLVLGGSIKGAISGSGWRGDENNSYVKDKGRRSED